jgi:hypothetical protein
MIKDHKLTEKLSSHFGSLFLIVAHLIKISQNSLLCKLYTNLQKKASIEKAITLVMVGFTVSLLFKN